LTEGRTLDALPQRIVYLIIVVAGVYTLVVPTFGEADGNRIPSHYEAAGVSNSRFS
jgi:hypothetical protein